MKRFVIFMIALALTVAGLVAWHLHHFPLNESFTHHFILVNFLKSHPGLRLMLEKECGCDEDISRMRWGENGVPAEPNYTPYYASGDFNSDGQEDFAVMLHSVKREDKSLSVAVFNGPFHGLNSDPALLEDGVYGALFPPQAGCKECRLLIGAFESDNVDMSEPKERGYELKYAGPTDEDASGDDQTGGGHTVAPPAYSDGGGIVHGSAVGSAATVPQVDTAPSVTPPSAGAGVEQSSPAIPASSASSVPANPLS